MRRLLAGTMLAAGSAVAVLAQNPQLPAVKSGVELIAVDVEVVAGNGEPIAGLLPSDFDVRIDGRPRRVVSADFVRYNTTAVSVTTVTPEEPAPPPPAGSISSRSTSTASARPP